MDARPRADPRVAAAEEAYLALREAHDRLEVDRASGASVGDAAGESEAKLAGLVIRVDGTLADVDAKALDPVDRRAVDVMRATLDEIRDELGSDGSAAGKPDDPLTAAFTHASQRLLVDGEAVGRLAIIGRLARERDPVRRRSLFLALEPLWRAVDGDGGEESPYRRRLATARSGGDDSAVDANARALDIGAAIIEAWCEDILGAWRTAFVGPDARDGEPLEPWDWWWAAGEPERLLAPVLRLDRILAVNAAYHVALGADPDALGIRLDVTPRDDRPPVTVAYTTFGARPHRRDDGTWSPGAPTVFANYTDGGLGELTELVHETGHAIHIAAIRTRPAFADWPDSDALTEALGELTALDIAEPAWQRRWLGPAAPAVPLDVSLRGRYADVALDTAWALFEIRVLRDPSQRPSDVWADITGRWLGIAPHPEWSWWAIRGQLVTDPGYMVNYAVGAVLAADLRAAIRKARGNWLAGDPGWYAWVGERIYRVGRERTSGEVVRDVLGRPPMAAALLTEIGRATRA